MMQQMMHELTEPSNEDSYILMDKRRNKILE